jgi:lipoyl(octanoyl) transferase
VLKLATGRLLELGCISYSQAWDWKHQWVSQKLVNEQCQDGLMLLEHPAVYTLGTGSSEKHLKFDPRFPPAALFRTERGGEVTYHCPGQLVGYPILDLRHFRQDLHWYLRQLEEVLIKTLAVFGLRAERVAGLTGVWLEGVKVAAIAIKVTRWITFHGFALNVCPDLSGFEQINPCGISNRSVGSLAQFLPEITRQDVQPVLIKTFAEVMTITWSEDRTFPHWLTEGEFDGR